MLEKKEVNYLNLINEIKSKIKEHKIDVEFISTLSKVELERLKLFLNYQITLTTDEIELLKIMLAKPSRYFESLDQKEWERKEAELERERRLSNERRRIKKIEDERKRNKNKHVIF